MFILSIAVFPDHFSDFQLLFLLLSEVFFFFSYSPINVITLQEAISANE